MAVINGKSYQSLDHGNLQLGSQQIKDITNGKSLSSSLTPTPPLILPSGSPPPPPLSSSPPPRPPFDDSELEDDSEKNGEGDEAGHDKEDSLDSSSSSNNSFDIATPPISELHTPSSDVTVQIVNKDDQTETLGNGSSIPSPAQPRRTKSTGILNYPSDHSQLRTAFAEGSGCACGAIIEGSPEAGQIVHIHSAWCSSSSLNVKFAPLPELAPRRRKSNVPLGVAARGQMMRKRRQMMMNANGDYSHNYQYQLRIQSQQQHHGDVVDAEQSELAAAQARARHPGGYGVDEDGEEMEDPFVVLGRMFKGAWKSMRGKGKAGKEKEGSEGPSEDVIPEKESLGANEIEGAPSLPAPVQVANEDSKSDTQKDGVGEEPPVLVGGEAILPEESNSALDAADSNRLKQEI
ncbi:hypothetical protein L218DRAFT_946029 [Marasmius fiardii PR-910]|nr:hypothetical protein L218DRAFT_946029 [Marasmius fiardii PR-910]